MKLHSMTGFALARREHTAGSVVLEMRSVNSRFLDPQFRISEELRAGESVIRELLSQRLARGKLDCRFYINRASQAKGGLEIDQELVDQLGRLDQTVRARLPEARGLRVAEVLHWPGVLKESELDSDSVVVMAKELAHEAIEQMVAARAREGEKLGSAILERVVAMEAITARLAPLVPQLVSSYQQKLTDRLSTALGIALDAPGASGKAVTTREDALERVRQEVTLYGVRIDVAEELSRLAAHLGETRRILATGGSCGKRLDFMMQELNREANTLGSKSASSELADAAMEMKLLIEQMREQVQNLE
jgi:uncharacterized protein (TIGR00255 family)